MTFEDPYDAIKILAQEGAIFHKNGMIQLSKKELSDLGNDALNFLTYEWDYGVIDNN